MGETSAEVTSKPRLEPAASRAVLLHVSHANVSISHRQVSWKSIFKCINIYALIYKMLRQSFFVEMLAGARSPPRRTQSPREEAPYLGSGGVRPTTRLWGARLAGDRSRISRQPPSGSGLPSWGRSSLQRLKPLTTLKTSFKCPHGKLTGNS